MNSISHNFYLLQPYVIKFRFVFILILLVFIVSFLSACIVKKGGGNSAGVDTSLVTGSVHRSPAIALEMQAHKDIVLAKFVKLEQNADKAKKQVWQNDSAKGVLTLLPASKAQTNAAPRQCRNFETTRESYDGTSLYKGKACRFGQAPWVLNSLKKV